MCNKNRGCILSQAYNILPCEKVSLSLQFLLKGVPPPSDFLVLRKAQGLERVFLMCFVAVCGLQKNIIENLQYSFLVAGIGVFVHPFASSF